ncbi:hypothetical protein [Nitrospira sp. M1]
MTKDLFLAILSMDSYNRGYNAGIEGLSDEIGTQIGTATISGRSNSNVNSSEVNAGFYAVAYEWTNPETGLSETIISYRGTDNLLLPEWVQDWYSDSDDGGSDLWNGYSTGVGDSSTEQAKLAAEFYQAVTETQDSDPLTGSATLTGHSLGGGRGYDCYD